MRAVLCACVLALVLATQGQAQRPNVGIVPFAGYNFDVEEVFFAGGVSIPIPRAAIGRGVLIIQPAFALYPFIDPGSLWAIGANAIVNFPLSGTTPIEPYASAGLLVARRSVSGSSDSDAFLNLGGGLAFAQSFFRTHPFVEIGLLIGSESSVEIRGGVRIATVR